MDGIQGEIKNGTLTIDLDTVDSFVIFHGEKIPFIEFIKRIAKDDDDDD